MINIKKIHHIAIITSDYNSSKLFYSEILGFKILKETYRSNRNSYKLDLLTEGGIQIELFSFQNPPERLTNPEATGLRHLAFQVEDIEKSVSYLTSKGISVEPVRIDEITGKKFTFFRDPDNLPLELYEE
ncbi:VOC family protein [uncultured Fusobacterium sp.]|jgi:glyoxylase I family protein|uniref:SMU1112c/YaeR family gloxylase I-like metalloprotein n=1 Tax=uncultured Fusobacterium sp. TaxID=159267 RepID=UPI00258CACA7|nr:VOC family protein [uncultured Fusobacterium sp.]